MNNRICWFILLISKSDVLNLDTYVARMKECRSAFKILTGKLTEMSPLERHRNRLEYNSLELKEMGISTRSWVDSAQE